MREDGPWTFDERQFVQWIVDSHLGRVWGRILARDEAARLPGLILDTPRLAVLKETFRARHWSWMDGEVRSPFDLDYESTRNQAFHLSRIDFGWAVGRVLLARVLPHLNRWGIRPETAEQAMDWHHGSRDPHGRGPKAAGETMVRRAERARLALAELHRLPGAERDPLVLVTAAAHDDPRLYTSWVAKVAGYEHADIVAMCCHGRGIPGAAHDCAELDAPYAGLGDAVERRLEPVTGPNGHPNKRAAAEVGEAIRLTKAGMENVSHDEMRFVRVLARQKANDIQGDGDLVTVFGDPPAAQMGRGGDGALAALRGATDTDWREFAALLLSRLEPPPTPEEIAARLDIPPFAVRDAATRADRWIGHGRDREERIVALTTGRIASGHAQPFDPDSDVPLARLVNSVRQRLDEKNDDLRTALQERFGHARWLRSARLLYSYFPTRWLDRLERCRNEADGDTDGAVLKRVFADLTLWCTVDRMAGRCDCLSVARLVVLTCYCSPVKDEAIRLTVPMQTLVREFGAPGLSAADNIQSACVAAVTTLLDDPDIHDRWAPLHRTTKPALTPAVDGLSPELRALDTLAKQLLPGWETDWTLFEPRPLPDLPTPLADRAGNPAPVPSGPVPSRPVPSRPVPSGPIPTVRPPTGILRAWLAEAVAALEDGLSTAALVAQPSLSSSRGSVFCRVEDAGPESVVALLEFREASVSLIFDCELRDWHDNTLVFQPDERVPAGTRWAFVVGPPAVLAAPVGALRVPAGTPVGAGGPGAEALASLAELASDPRVRLLPVTGS